MPDKLNLGATLFLSLHSEWRPIPVTIIKVGRKWAYFEGSHYCGTKIDRETLEVGDGRYGDAYRSKGEWQNRLDAEMKKRADGNAWRQFRRKVSALYERPPGADSEAIKRCAELLGIPWEDAPDAR